MFSVKNTQMLYDILSIYPNAINFVGFMRQNAFPMCYNGQDDGIGVVKFSC